LAVADLDSAVTFYRQAFGYSGVVYCERDVTEPAEQLLGEVGSGLLRT
jgi:hypothetical protein